jgi:hypothetical protein
MFFSHSSVRPLPKMPNSIPVLLENPKHKHPERIDEQSSTPKDPETSLISPILPRRTTEVEEIRRGNLSKLRRYLGYSVPPDLVPPKLDRESDNWSSGEEECHDFPIVPMTPQCLSELTEAISPILERTTDQKREKMIRTYSRRWLREKKGRRWIEDDYNIIIQSLRALR